MIRVLFVCLGNICRSPMAEGIFKDMIKEKKLEENVFCDSAGTSDWHIGEQPDPRAIENARLNGVELNHAARQFSPDDLLEFDYVLVMDHNNLAIVKDLAETYPDVNPEIFLTREFDKPQNSLVVPDPYFGGEDGFQEVFEILIQSSRNFLEFLIQKHRL